MDYIWLNGVLILLSLFCVVFIEKIPKYLVVYDEPDNYPYLEKIFDSKEHDLKFNIKIFKINFLQFGI